MALVVLTLLLLAIALLLWFGAGSAAIDKGASGPVTPPAADASTPTAISTPGVCHSVNGLPDPVCTPGVVDPRVTQDNIHTTICVSGYTTKVRPSSSYTDALKQQQIKAYGYADTNLADYEEDHLIPLEVGGHPSDPRNLWPEPRSGPYPAAKKDGLENALHAAVCNGAMTLVAAQRAIATNWETAR
jgi:hypothetical protein